MRDEKFIAQHQGGPLEKEEHHQLIKWASRCSEHVLPLLHEKVDQRLMDALEVARGWGEGDASVGEARKRAVAAHNVARESSDQTAVYVARSVGHTVATAHMADHSLGAAWYALKAVKNAGGSVDAEKKWQNEQLPIDIRELVLKAREKNRFKKI